MDIEDVQYSLTDDHTAITLTTAASLCYRKVQRRCTSKNFGIFVKLRLPGRSGPENFCVPSLRTSNTSEKISIVADLSLMTLIE